MKGEATIDWSDKRARTALLSLIAADADRLLELSRQAQGELPEDGEEAPADCGGGGTAGTVAAPGRGTRW